MGKRISAKAIIDSYRSKKKPLSGLVANFFLLYEFEVVFYLKSVIPANHSFIDKVEVFKIDTHSGKRSDPIIFEYASKHLGTPSHKSFIDPLFLLCAKKTYDALRNIDEEEQGVLLTKHIEMMRKAGRFDFRDLYEHIFEKIKSVYPIKERGDVKKIVVVRKRAVKVKEESANLVLCKTLKGIFNTFPELNTLFCFHGNTGGHKAWVTSIKSTRIHIFAPENDDAKIQDDMNKRVLSFLEAYFEPIKSFNIEQQVVFVENSVAKPHLIIRESNKGLFGMRIAVYITIVALMILVLISWVYIIRAGRKESSNNKSIAVGACPKDTLCFGVADFSRSDTGKSDNEGKELSRTLVMYMNRELQRRGLDNISFIRIGMPVTNEGELKDVYYNTGVIAVIYGDMQRGGENNISGVIPKLSFKEIRSPSRVRENSITLRSAPDELAVQSPFFGNNSLELGFDIYKDMNASLDYLLGIIYCNLGDYESGISHIKVFADRYKNDKNVAYIVNIMLAHAYTTLNKEDEAKEILTNTDVPDISFYEGLLYGSTLMDYYHLNRKGYELLKRAQMLNPNDIRGQISEAWYDFLSNQQDIMEKREYFKQRLHILWKKSGKLNIYWFSKLGLVTYELGLYDELIKMDKKNSNLYCWYAVFLSKYNAAHTNKDVQTAITLLEKAVELDANNYYAYQALSGAYLGGGKEEEAVRMMRRLMEIKPESAANHYNYAFYMMSKGNCKDAIRHFDKAIELDGSDFMAYCMLSKIYESGKYYDHTEHRKNEEKCKNLYNATSDAEKYINKDFMDGYKTLKISCTF